MQPLKRVTFVSSFLAAASRMHRFVSRSHDGPQKYCKALLIGFESQCCHRAQTQTDKLKTNHDKCNSLKKKKKKKAQMQLKVDFFCLFKKNCHENCASLIIFWNNKTTTIES